MADFDLDKYLWMFKEGLKKYEEIILVTYFSGVKNTLYAISDHQLCAQLHRNCFSRVLWVSNKDTDITFHIYNICEMDGISEEHIETKWVAIIFINTYTTNIYSENVNNLKCTKPVHMIFKLPFDNYRSIRYIPVCWFTYRFMYV